MKSWKRMMTVVVVAGALGGNEAARAEGGASEPNYRCEAAKLRAESRELSCKDHCQRNAAGKAAESRDEWRAACDADCHQRCEDKKHLIDIGPLCTDRPPTPNPDRCASKLLSALAQLEFCISICPNEEEAMFTDLAETRVPRSATCRSSCNDNYADADQRIRALDVCAHGKFPVCVYQ